MCLRAFPEWYPCHKAYYEAESQAKGTIVKIGVSGASGKLGAAIVRELKARAPEHAIVAISRTVGTLGRSGMEARFGDFDQPASLAKAYEGLDKLLIIPTAEVTPGRRGAQNIAGIDAAVAAGVGHIVLFSSAGTCNKPEPDIYASYFAGEQHLMRKARQWSVLRMNYYAEAFAQEAQMSLAHGAIAGISENKVAFVSRDDLAAAAAGLLTSKGHDGAIYTGTGPASLTGAERAAAAAKASGKPVQFVCVPVENLCAQFGQAGLPPDVINAVISIQEAFVAGGFDIVTGDIEQLAGRPPRPLSDVLSAAFGA
jgi:NAD(P)H dehydrogenase (quinone)